MYSAESSLVLPRRWPKLRFWLVAILLLWAPCAQPLRAQGTVSSLNIAGFRKPIEIGTTGVIQIGDSPKYAEADFDDSHWQRIDRKTRLRDYFPGDQQAIVWRRLHVRVNPSDTGLALSIEPYGIDRAFEIFVNSRQLLVSGQVEPYVPYTRAARLIVPIPDDQLRTGLLIIAIRQRAPFATWNRVNAAFSSKSLTLGPETELRDRITLRLIHDKGMQGLLALLGFGVGSAALLLITSRTHRMEYYCIFSLGLIQAVRFVFYLCEAIWNIPALWILFDLCLNNLNVLVFLLLSQEIMHKRLPRWAWFYALAACLLMSGVTIGHDLGKFPPTYTDLLSAPFYGIFAVVVPLLLFRQFRRGNREAGFMILFLFFWSAAMYAVVILAVINLLSILPGAADYLIHSISGYEIGPLSISIFDMGTLLFWVTLAFIMVLWAARNSRIQTVLEGEMAAARAVQHVILPEQVDAISGFSIESVYLPAQQVGGDFFQVLELADGGLLVVLGDVAGKGLPAAMLVSVLVGAIRATAKYSHAPDQVLASLNERLIGRFNGGFSTALAAHIDRNGVVSISNAGHLSPYLDGHEMELPGALPLGVLSGIQYETIRFELAPGSRIIFYSDGVVEARNHRGELFGFDRTSKISTQSAAAIVEAARAFGQSDDITVVAITRDAAQVAAA